MKKIFKLLKYCTSALFIIIFIVLSNIPQYSQNFNFSYFLSNFDYTNPYLWIVFSISIILYILLSYDLFIKSFKAIKNKDFFNENTLMVIASIGALIIGELAEGLAVILLYKIGEEFENYAVNRSKKEISSLVKLKSYKARIKENGQYVLKNINDIKINDRIYVFAGENVPLDIKLSSSIASIDQKALTGESLPIEKNLDDEIYSGSINLSNTIEGVVIKENKDSTISRIIKLIQESTANKSKNEKFITKFARIYTPIVIVLSILIFIIGSSITFNWNEWLYRAIEILVVSCPCSMVISIPIAYMLSIGKSSKNGILVKGGNYLDVINKSKTIVFDKTGTLTKGELSVTSFKLLNDFSNEEEFYSIIYNLEKNSNHPIAKAIKNFVKNKKIIDLDLNIKEIAGIKIEAYDKLNNHYEIGNKSILNKNDLDNLGDLNLLSTNVVVLKNNIFIGYILFEDTYKDNIKEDIELLYKSGYKKAYILSGDNKNIVSKVAKDLNITNYFSELLPEEKVNKIKELKSIDNSLTYVGDGINDAPSLAISPIGISMGKLGSDVAIESSDVSIQDDKISKISFLKSLAKYNYFVVMSNIIASIIVKVIIMILAITGIGNLWIAIFADVGMLILCLLNALTIILYKTKAYQNKKIG